MSSTALCSLNAVVASVPHRTARVKGAPSGAPPTVWIPVAPPAGPVRLAGHRDRSSNLGARVRSWHRFGVPSLRASRRRPSSPNSELRWPSSESHDMIRLDGQNQIRGAAVAARMASGARVMALRLRVVVMLVLLGSGGCRILVGSGRILPVGFTNGSQGLPWRRGWRVVPG